MSDPFKHSEWLSTETVVERIETAISNRTPLSIVRVGDGENLCLAQYRVWPIKKVLATRWGRLSRTTNMKGVHLPNVILRDQLIQSIKRADIVGIPNVCDREILAKQTHLRPLTERCFQAYRIEPGQICHTFVNRHMVEMPSFWKMLGNKKVVIVYKYAEKFKKWIRKAYQDLDIEVVGTVPITSFDQIPSVLKRLETVDCDVVLVSAGVNAVILCEQLASMQGKVAVDFGKSAVFMLYQRTDRVRPWLPTGSPSVSPA